MDPSCYLSYALSESLHDTRMQEGAGSVGEVSKTVLQGNDEWRVTT